jgi:hypothetical protein
MPKPLKSKRIPTADSSQLREELDHIHGSIHTPEGLHKLDQPRGIMVHTGMKAHKITSELQSREPGYQNPCKFCLPDRNLGQQFH